MSTPKEMSYDQFAFEHKLTTDYEVQGHIHAGLMAEHMPKSYHRRYQKRILHLQDERDQGQHLYRQAIERGEITPPVEMSNLVRLEAAAKRHPDLASTQAAIRALQRRKQNQQAKEEEDRAAREKGEANG